MQFPPAQFDAEFISRTFFPKFYPSQLHRINHGECYDWAYYGYCLFPTVKLWTTENHAWIQDGDGLYYDSETHQGIAKHDRLPCNRVCGWEEQHPTEMNVDQFKTAWQEWGIKTPHHWLRLRRNIHEREILAVRT